jgi:hypothetical protein
MKPYLNKELMSQSSLGTHIEDQLDFGQIKQRLKRLLAKKMIFLNEQLAVNQSSNDLNETVGAGLLKALSDSANLTPVELDKYKLLVNETDVIVNLLLKLCNKLAHTENLIQLKQIQLMRKSEATREYDCVDKDDKKSSINEEIVMTVFVFYIFDSSV